MSPSCLKLATIVPPLLSGHALVDAVGASGGLLTAWDGSCFSLASQRVGRFSLTVELVSSVDDLRVFVTNVYAPCVAAVRDAFFEEMLQLVPHCSGAWLLAGDFNIARRPDERNNDLFDASLASAFNVVLDHLLLQELPLLDRKYTWSSMREQPTLVRLDWAFINLAWATELCDSTLCSAVRDTSDHVPLVLSATSSVPISPLFRYEKGWAFYDDYRALVENVWQRPCNQVFDPVLRLSKKLKWVRAESKKLARSRFRPDAVILSCRNVIDLLDRLEEIRWLSAAESMLRALVKTQLAADLQIKSVYWRQRSATATSETKISGSSMRVHQPACARTRFRSCTMVAFLFTLTGPKRGSCLTFMPA
jgi:hypothetical protein